MKVIVVQKDSGDLRCIKESVAEVIGADRADEMLFSADLSEILAAVESCSQVLIISGQMLLLDRRANYGTDLARLVKRINPGALFYIYSAMPAWNECVDGVIPKNYDGLLEKILASDLASSTPSALLAKFPTIISRK